MNLYLMMEIPRTNKSKEPLLMVEIKNGDVNKLVMESTDSRIIDTTLIYSVLQRMM